MPSHYFITSSWIISERRSSFRGTFSSGATNNQFSSDGDNRWIERGTRLELSELSLTLILALLPKRALAVNKSLKPTGGATSARVFDYGSARSLSSGGREQAQSLHEGSAGRSARA